MITVPTYSVLESLKNKKENEMALVEKEQKVYIYKDNKWTPFKSEDNSLKLSLYDINKQIISQKSALTFDERLQLKEIVQTIIKDKKYFMLLNNELRYYTVFNRDPKNEETLYAALLDCLDHIGLIKSVEYTEDSNALEIWVTTDDDSYIFYFFEYGEGVIECQ